MYFFFLDINENGKSKTLVVSLSLSFILLFIATIICLLRVGYEYFKKRKINGNKEMTFSKRDQEWGTMKQVKQWQRKTWQRWTIRKTTKIMNVILGLEILSQSFDSKVFFSENFHFFSLFLARQRHIILKNSK